MAIEACRLALKYMTPVVYLSDAFLATGSEPWSVPDLADLPDIRVANATDPATFRPYQRDPETLARPWAVPGTAGLEHRIGGLEKADITGNVSYDPDNHHKMQLLPPGQGRRHRRRTSRRSRSSGPSAATCSSSAGARPTARSGPRSSACRPTASRSPTPTCAT